MNWKWITRADMKKLFPHPRETDRDRNWREMMTHWNEYDGGIYRTYLPNTKANRDIIYGPATATIDECLAEMDRIEKEMEA